MSNATTTGLVDLLLRQSHAITESATAAAQTLVLDFLGVATAGSATVEGRHIRSTMQALGRAGDCSIPVYADRFDPATAALITATMGYSIGLTDTHARSITHPGPTVIPVALAVGQAVGASGRDILDAIVLGAEAIVRIGAVVNPSHRTRGFHPTATCNVFGAAVAASHLLGSDRATMQNALGIAGSMSSGIYEFRHEGSMLMALHAGWPAQSGITAAYLAANGFTGPSTVLEGPEGFFHAFADDVKLDLLLAEHPTLGIEELSLRPYCSCRYAHAGIDALETIWRQHGGRAEPEQIKKVIVWTHRTAVVQEVEPNSIVGARLSTRFNIAHAIVHGPTLVDIGAADLVDPVVASVGAITTVEEDPALTKIFPEKWACRVEVELTTGQTYEHLIDTPKGEPENPLSRFEVEAKFRQLATTHLGEAGATALIAAVTALPTAPDGSQLTNALIGHAAHKTHPTEGNNS
jgi:2-methylcitrate dehydratase PrpD